MELKTYFAQDAAGNIISSAIVNVFLHGTTTLATGLTRADGTPLENPFAADGAGRIQFRAPDGYYDVQVSAGPGIIQTLTIQCVDYSEAKADADRAKADADRAEAAADRADVSAEQAQNALNSITGINTNFKQNSREQWRRSLADAGLTLVSGSFEEGATVNSETDVVWHIASGQCYTWGGAFPKTVAAGSTPTSTGGVGSGAWVSVGDTSLRSELASSADGKGDAMISVKQPLTGAAPRTQHDKNAEIVSVKDFGAVGDGVNDDTAAFQKAFAAYASIFIPAGTYKVTDLTLDKSAYGEQQVSVVHGNGAIITGNSVTLLGWRKVKASGLKFSVSGYVTLMDVRNCTFSDIDFGATRFGRWEELGRATYSIYWNKFNECRFAGMYAKTDIDSANFNSNVFDSCELRRRLDTDDAIFYFYETPNHKAVFSGITFIGCDASYTAVFKVVDPHITWAVVWVGGFIDSGSKWFADGSNEVTTFDVVGARVTARDARPYTTPTANIGMQSGGIKNSRYIPAGSLSYLPRFKRTVAGTEVITILSLPLPCSGEWTISANLKETGTGLESTAIANKTKGGGRTYDLIEHSGFSTTTFKADAGDVIEIIFDGKVGTATEIQSLSLTLGAGVPSAVEVNDTGRRSITNLSVGVATTIFSFTIPDYSQAAYDMQLVCKNKTANGAGLLSKRASVLAAKTSGAARVNILEYSESSLAGDAGTSANAGTCTLTSSVSGNNVSIMATLGNTGAAGITDAELVLIAKEL